jgi:hemerythrin-like metal-binding protein
LRGSSQPLTTGYPRGLSGSDIPFFGRICAIADTFDALGTHRPYKEPWKVEDILDYMRRQSGSQFDPKLVDSFFVALPQILKFREVYADEMLVESPPTYLTPIQPADRKAFPWRGAYASGLHTIDVHHCYLFELTNNLSESLHSGGQIGEIAAAFKALEGYTKIHFREEERLMEACRYSALAEHRQEHARFIAMLDQSWEEMRRNPLLVGHKLLDFLKKWLVNHIMVPDRKAAAEWLHVRLALCPLGSVSAWLCVRLALCPAWLRVRLAPCPPPTRSAMT